MPDVGSLTVYGVSWVGVTVIVIGLLRRFVNIGEEASAIVAGVFAVAGYVLVQVLPDVEIWLPWLPEYLPIVLTAILIFGASLGLVPGTTASKVANRILGK